jgi:hypothetical protein
MINVNFLDTKQWYKPPIQGNPNVGRFAHSATVIGSKMYIFGGQSDGYFLNDLIAFDLQSRKFFFFFFEIYYIFKFALKKKPFYICS